MISRTELQYVNNWATKTPHPGTTYSEEVLIKLQEAVKRYEEKYSNRRYEMVFSNGEQLFLEISAKNLCHMLGIDYKNLIGHYFDDFRTDILEMEPTYKPTSYELLNALLKHGEQVLAYDYKKGNVVNYYRVRIKCDIFEKLSNFTNFDFSCILFDKDKYQEVSEKSAKWSATKFFYLPSQEALCPYFMMGIGKDEEEEYHFVETLIAPTSPEHFFKEQTVVIPTQMIVTDTDTMHKYNATAAEKIQLLNQYRALVGEYKIPNKLDTFGDYMSTLSEQQRVEEKAKTLIK